MRWFGVVGLMCFAVVLSACGESESTTTTAAAVPATTTTAAPTTTTTTTTLPPTTTTTAPEADPNPFVGWWEATDVDGSHLDLRVDSAGTFTYWDSASGICEAQGLGHSPQTWMGTAAFELEEAAVMTVSGTRMCFPYEADNEEIGEAAADYWYLAETDMLEFVADGVRYERAPAPPSTFDANPFVGLWEATDSDGTRMTMTIAPSGDWEMLDTRSGGCERMGLTYATWSADGTGFFDLGVGATPTFSVVTTTMCHPVDGDSVPRSEDVQLSYEYRAESDEVALLLFLETIFTRVD